MAKPRKDDRFKSTLCKNRILHEANSQCLLALKIYALKKGISTTEAFNLAVEKSFPEDMEIARQAIAERNGQ